MLSSRGQSLIETVVGMMTLVIFVTALASGLYCLWAKQRLSLLTYEALICLETRGEKFCDLRFLKQAKKSLPFGRVKILKNEKTSNQRTRVVRYDGKPISISVQQSIALPLR